MSTSSHRKKALNKYYKKYYIILYIVRFISEDSVEAIPTTWITSSNMCYWPNFIQDKIIAAIKKHEPPNTDWPRHQITLFKNGTYDNYTIARAKAKKAEYKSDLNDAEDDINSRKMRHFRKLSSSESDEGDMSIFPPPPPIPILKNKKKGELSDQLDQTSEKVNNPVCIKEKTGSTSASLVNDDLKKELTLLRTEIELFKTSVMENIRSLKKKTDLLTSVVTEAMADIKRVSLKINTEEKVQAEDRIFTKFNMPIDTVEELMDFEEFLKDESNMKSAVLQISNIGGDSTYNFVKRVLSMLLNDNLSQKYTWYGTKNKKALQKFKLAELLFAAGENIKVDRKSIENAVRKYLRRGKERWDARERKPQTTASTSSGGVPEMGN